MARTLLITASLLVAASGVTGCARRDRDYDRHARREVIVYPETERVVRYREEPYYGDAGHYEYRSRDGVRQRIWVRESY